MEFSLNKSVEILKTTPNILTTYLGSLSDEWLHNNEGENTWSPYDVVQHLIVGEKTDWLVRIKIILSAAEDRTFEPFDRFAHLEDGSAKSITELLKEFQTLRENNLRELKSFNLTENDFSKTGIHPELGTVTLKQLLATWAVHDLGHIAQIARVMTKQYKTEVGPWTEYLGILKK